MFLSFHSSFLTPNAALREASLSLKKTLYELQISFRKKLCSSENVNSSLLTPHSSLSFTSSKFREVRIFHFSNLRCNNKILSIYVRQFYNLKQLRELQVQDCNAIKRKAAGF